MTEKYLSGVKHPSEVFEEYLKLDVFDKERFIEMLANDEDSLKLLTENLAIQASVEDVLDSLKDVW